MDTYSVFYSQSAMKCSWSSLSLSLSLSAAIYVGIMSDWRSMHAWRCIPCMHTLFASAIPIHLSDFYVLLVSLFYEFSVIGLPDQMLYVWLIIAHNENYTYDSSCMSMFIVVSCMQSQSP